MMTEPCPFCAHSNCVMTTPQGESRGCVQCVHCGAKGPISGVYDKRNWWLAAIEDWNIWALAKRAYDTPRLT